MYTEINFTEFMGRRRMKGSLRGRGSDGKTLSGTFEVHQVSDGLVHTREVQSDGTVMTGKMTQVSEQ